MDMISIFKMKSTKGQRDEIPGLLAEGLGVTPF